MFDILPYPNIDGNTAEEKLNSLFNFLCQFKEDLEFILNNIGTDNLSKELIDKLENIGVDISAQEQNTEDIIGQIVKRSISVRDVIDSDLFRQTLDAYERQIIEALGEMIPTVHDITSSEEFVAYITTLKSDIEKEIPTVSDLIESDEFTDYMADVRADIIEEVESEIPTVSDITTSDEFIAVINRLKEDLEQLIPSPSDIVASDDFKAYMDGMKEEIIQSVEESILPKTRPSFSVNFETGDLEYEYQGGSNE